MQPNNSPDMGWLMMMVTFFANFRQITSHNKFMWYNTFGIICQMSYHVFYSLIIALTLFTWMYWSHFKSERFTVVQALLISPATYPFSSPVTSRDVDFGVGRCRSLGRCGFVMDIWWCCSYRCCLNFVWFSKSQSVVSNWIRCF